MTALSGWLLALYLGAMMRSLDALEAVATEAVHLAVELEAILAGVEVV